MSVGQSIKGNKSALTANENIAHRKLQTRAKAMLRGNFIALNVCIREEGKSQINNLSWNLGKEEYSP